MNKILLAPAYAEPIVMPAGSLSASLQSYYQDLQTGLIELDMPGLARHYLFLAGGQLINIYRINDPVERLEPSNWLESIDCSRKESSVRMLALTPQAVRLLKIKVEQHNDRRGLAAEHLTIEAQFEKWMQHPFPALAHVLWPNAEGLTLFPGQGGSPQYTLFMADNQVLHSAGSVMALYGWKENYCAAALFSSEPRTLAWNEYMLNLAFSSLISTLLEKFEQLTGRILLNQVIRDVNFTATAHSWNIRLDAARFTDQGIYSSPQAAADVYDRLLQVVLRHFESALGFSSLGMLISESLSRIASPYRQVLDEFLPILRK